jgi:signal transduction histidine kinase
MSMTTESLSLELATIRHGDHICLTYDGDDARDDVVVPFIADGIARGERCVYVLERDGHPAWLDRLAAGGINVARAAERGALWLLTPEETYFRTGAFDPEDALNAIDELIAAALGDGFTGMRGSGELGQRYSDVVPWEALFEYEARVNERFAKRPFVGLCRYHRATFCAASIHDVLRTHPTAFVGNRLCRNPYYERPDVALAGDPEGARVEWMLRQLRWSRLTEVRLQEMTRSLAEQTARLSAENLSYRSLGEEQARALRLRDQLLATLADELAVPVASLGAELRAMADAPSPVDPCGTTLGTLVRQFADLETLVSDLRDASRLTSRERRAYPDDADLTDVTREVTLRHRDLLERAGCAVSFHAEARIPGRWDRHRLEQLLGSLLTNAAQRGAGRPIDVVLSTDGPIAMVAVTYTGDAPAPDEVDRAPRPWACASELGLWIARDIAGALGGSIDVARVAPDKTTFTVEIPRSPTRAHRA